MNSGTGTLPFTFLDSTAVTVAFLGSRPATTYALSCAIASKEKPPADGLAVLSFLSLAAAFSTEARC
jgi:hypothetical protein